MIRKKKRLVPEHVRDRWIRIDVSKKKKKKIVSRTVQVPFRVVHSGSLQSIPVVDICRADQKKNQRKKMLRGLATYSKDRENEVCKIV